MQIIKTDAALNAVTDPSLRPILERYADLMELAEIFIVGPTDTLADLEHARGWLTACKPLRSTPATSLSLSRPTAVTSTAVRP